MGFKKEKKILFAGLGLIGLLFLASCIILGILIYCIIITGSTFLVINIVIVSVLMLIISLYIKVYGYHLVIRIESYNKNEIRLSTLLISFISNVHRMQIKMNNHSFVLIKAINLETNKQKLFLLFKHQHNIEDLYNIILSKDS